MPRNTNSVYRAVFTGQMQGQAVINVLHFRTVLDDASQMTLTRFQEFATDAHNWWRTSVLPLLSSTYLFIRTGFVEIAGRTDPNGQPGPPFDDLDPVYDALHIANAPANDIGSAAGDPLPNQTAGVINLLTALAGRRNRGRVKLGGLLEFDNGPNGLMTGVAKAAIDAAFGTLVTNGLTSPTGGIQQMKLVILSWEKLKQLPLVNPMRLGTEVVTQAVTNVNWGQQRSRRQRLVGA